MPTGHTNSDLFNTVLAMLKEDGRFDLNRVYATGQSAGSSLTASLAVDNSKQLAAVFPSNAGTPSPFSGGLPIPSAVIVGEGNSGSQGIPGATAEQLANVKMYMAATVDADGKPSGMAKWVAYYTDANGLSAKNLSPFIKYSGSNALNGGKDTDEGTLAEWDTNGARFRTFTWSTPDGIPVLQFVMSLYEAHNNIAVHAAMMWDFMEHYKLDLKTGTRYYSKSGFTINDSKVIVRP
jgi:poly(3-hydroxybutyrate) depolymerase